MTSLARGCSHPHAASLTVPADMLPGVVRSLGGCSNPTDQEDALLLSPGSSSLQGLWLRVRTPSPALLCPAPGLKHSEHWSSAKPHRDPRGEVPRKQAPDYNSFKSQSKPSTGETAALGISCAQNTGSSCLVFHNPEPGLMRKFSLLLC